jgi:hypothetical protein
MDAAERLASMNVRLINYTRNGSASTHTFRQAHIPAVRVALTASGPPFQRCTPRDPTPTAAASLRATPPSLLSRASDSRGGGGVV